MRSPSVVQRLKELPDSPGVYLFQDARGKVLYVGKAISLRKRVLTYFQSSRPLTKKTMNLVDQTKKIDWINTASEAEALLVEASLIKSKQPKYNVMLRDDKEFLMLRVDVDQAFPTFELVRKNDGPGRYFGPYASAASIRETLRTLSRIFPIKRCSAANWGKKRRRCLEHQMGR